MQRWTFTVSVVFLVGLYLLPLTGVVCELISTEGFTGFPNFSHRLARALAEFDDLTTILRQILTPLIVGISAATAIPRLVTLKTGVLAAILVLGLALAGYIILGLNDDSILPNWTMHGYDPKDLELLKGYTRQCFESFLAYLALIAGVGGVKELELKPPPKPKKR